MNARQISCFFVSAVCWAILVSIGPVSEAFSASRNYSDTVFKSAARYALGVRDNFDTNPELLRAVVSLHRKSLLTKRNDTKLYSRYRSLRDRLVDGDFERLDEISSDSRLYVIEAMLDFRIHKRIQTEADTESEEFLQLELAREFVGLLTTMDRVFRKTDTDTVTRWNSFLNVFDGRSMLNRNPEFWVGLRKVVTGPSWNQLRNIINERLDHLDASVSDTAGILREKSSDTERLRVPTRKYIQESTSVISDTRVRKTVRHLMRLKYQVERIQSLVKKLEKY